jgi:TPP-dependent trihydroxycyclohexane-1,2-dione (THcHDO) dehydratase
VDATGIPVGETMAGKGSLRWDHPLNLGAIGATGTLAANRVARDADLVIGIGTRYSDFTTASKTAWQHPDVRFVNINVAEFDAGKHNGLAVVGDAESHAGGAGRTAGRFCGGFRRTGPRRSGCTTPGTPRCSASTTSAWSPCPARAS